MTPSQLKEQLTKLNDIRSATPQPKGTPPPYSGECVLYSRCNLATDRKGVPRGP